MEIRIIKVLLYIHMYYVHPYIILYLFYIKLLFTNLFLFSFQTKDSNTHAYAHSCDHHTMVTETKKTTFEAVSFIMCFYTGKETYPATQFFCWQVSFRWMKETYKTVILEAYFLITLLILINKLNHH